MGEHRGNSSERVARFFRNVNIVGAIALGGAGLLLESPVLTTLGAIDVAQVVIFEAARRTVSPKPNHQ
jgi:hypothetical protein